MGLSVPLAMDPRPASEALAKLDSFIGEPPQPGDLTLRRLLLAMLGQLEEAWAVAAPAKGQAQELGLRSGAIWLSEIALIAGDLQAAADYLHVAREELEERGATAQRSTYISPLGRVLAGLGNPDEAEQLARKGRELGDPGDMWTQALWREEQDLVHATREEHAEAGQLAREAVDWWSRADSLLRQGDAYCTLAQVLEAAGRRDEAVAAWGEALDRYERKGIIPLARRVREPIAEIQATEA